MNIIKITNGEAWIKPFCTRKARKLINLALFKNATSGTDGKIVNLPIENIPKAEDAKVLNMVDKIILGGQNQIVDEDLIDSLSDGDFDLILKAVNNILEPAHQDPNE